MRPAHDVVMYGKARYTNPKEFKTLPGSNGAYKSGESPGSQKPSFLLSSEVGNEYCAHDGMVMHESKI
jgi:hypothetical protein